MYRDAEFTAFMDIHPWSPGHVLVTPMTHWQWVGEMPGPVRERLFGVTTRIAAAVRDSGIPCHDVHFLLNDGPAASQTVPHVHMHVLPRVRGDWPRRIPALMLRPLLARVGRKSRAALDDHARLIRSALTSAPGE